MTTVALLNTIIDDFIEMNNRFMDVAMGEGLAPVLMLVGAILTVFALAVFGVLTLGAIGSLFVSK